MTISLITGTPGSGKSLTMASRLRWKVKHKRPVVCNFDVCHDTKNYEHSYTVVENKDITPEFLEAYSDEYFRDRPFKEGQILLVIDECQILFSCRTWNDKDRMRWLEFFTQHRKYGYDIWLVTQFDSAIDKNIRNLVEYEHKCRKLNNVGWVGTLANILCLGHPLVVRVTYWYPMKQRLCCEWFIGTSRTYRFYETRKLFQGKQSAKAAKRAASA